MLEVQALASRPAPCGIGVVLSALLTHEPTRYVMEALLHTGTVKTRGQPAYRVLIRLSKLGIIAKGPTKGHWSASPDFAESLRALNRFLVRRTEWTES